MLTRAAALDAASIARAFAAEGIAPSRWSAAAGEIFAPHAHPLHKVLYCAAGSIEFAIEETGERITMAPGDRLDLPAGTRHSAVAGPRGVTCVEAMRG